MSPDTPRSDDPQEANRPPALSAEEVAELVRAILGGGGSVVPSKHFQKRGGERDFTTQDALIVLRTGTVRPSPVWNVMTESWNYDIGGNDIEGDALTVRVAFTSSKGIILVTAF